MMKDNNGRAASSLASSSSSSLKKEEDEDQALLMASFDDLSADVREALENLNLQSPTEIQSLAIPSIRDKGGNVCIRLSHRVRENAGVFVTHSGRVEKRRDRSRR